MRMSSYYNYRNYLLHFNTYIWTMTHKEEAQELFDRFYAISGNHPAAKKSALICVDEMMGVVPKNIDTMFYMKILSELQILKQEIKKL